jgi:heptosyltransferase-2
MLRATDRVLVRVPSWLGDAVMAEPAIRALAGRVGAPNLSLAGPAPFTELLASGLPGACTLAPQAVRSWRGHDVAVLFTNSFRSALSALRAGIPRRVGWARDGRSPLLTDAAGPAREAGKTPPHLGCHGLWPRPLPRPFGTSCIELVGLLGVGVAGTRPRLAPDERALAACERRLAGFGLAAGEPYIVANVGARPGSAKAYPPQQWVRALDALRERVDTPVLLVCGPAEESLAHDVAGAARPGLRLCVDPVAGLGELLALFGRARLVLSADGGPRHLAVSTGAPLVTVAGPTDPRHTADHLGSTRLFRERVDCGPCHLERCPIVGEAHHACMRRVEPTQLAVAALELLATA